jgi:hypothetical protein
VACLLASACNDLYLDKPGDDTTVAAIKLREELKVNIMVGPPVDKERDSEYIGEFLKKDGRHIVCGGTSSQIVARFLDSLSGGSSNEYVEKYYEVRPRK